MPVLDLPELIAPDAGGGLATAPVHVALIPARSGGVGHTGGTLKLARALERANSRLRITGGLDALDECPLSVEVVARPGYPYRILPNPVHHRRNEPIRANFGDVAVVIEDTNRRLIAHRRILPRLRAWISIPLPWDQLHMDWPLLAHPDQILDACPSVMSPPAERPRCGEKRTVTGPLLDVEEMPDRPGSGAVRDSPRMLAMSAARRGASPTGPGLAVASSTVWWAAASGCAGTGRTCVPC